MRRTSARRSPSRMTRRRTSRERNAAGASAPSAGSRRSSTRSTSSKVRAPRPRVPREPGDPRCGESPRTWKAGTMRRLIVGVSGASGSLYAIAALRALRAVPDVETHLILSQQARQTIELETDTTADEVEGLADVLHRDGDLAASVS